MPSGKTHDAITLLLAIPVGAATFVATDDLRLASLVTAGFIFGGLMFGPDLDTVSTQYSRWKIFRFLWIPYRTFFRHRSRWSHGLVFGTFLRVVYFMGAATLVAFLAVYAYSSYQGGSLPGLWDYPPVWGRLRQYADSIFGSYGLIGVFIGLWTGAASHTFTDLAGTYIKTGRARV